MPWILEGQVIADRAKLRPTGMFIALLVAIVMGVASGLWAHLHLYFQYGINPGRFEWVNDGFLMLQQRLVNPSTTHLAETGIIVLGGVIALALSALRHRFLWFPLHPAGFAVGFSNFMHYLWCPFLVGWLVKWLIMKHGGLHAYRRAIPLFVGIVLGDYGMTAVWALVRQVWRVPTYFGFWYPW